MLWLGGTRYNVIATGTSVTASPVADASFPTTKIYDGYPGDIFKFGSLTAAPSITFDIDMLGGTGSFETTVGFPVGWTTVLAGTGTVTQDTVNVVDGTKSAKFSAGSISASAYRDTVVRSGSTARLTAWLFADATGIMDAYVSDQRTGKYWNGTAWTSSAQIWAQQATPGGARYDTVIPVEDYDTVGGPTTVLRVLYINQQAASSGWVDATELIPGVNYCSIHGHNIDPRSAPKLRSSTDNFVAVDTLRATFDVVQPAFYSYLGSTFKSTAGYLRYWRVQFADTNTAAIYTGEVVLGDATAMSAGPLYPYEPSYSVQQVRVPRRFGAPNVYAMGTRALRTVPLKIQCKGLDSRNEFFREWRRCLDGTPVVVVPYTGTGHTDVVLGLLPEGIDHSWQMASSIQHIMNFQTSVTELPLPLIID